LCHENKRPWIDTTSIQEIITSVASQSTVKFGKMKELGRSKTGNQDEYIILLTNTISELYQQVEEQKQEISKLKNQISGY
ncbi:995_t:CDS:1, partial [Cetraspora pellucida]